MGVNVAHRNAPKALADAVAFRAQSQPLPEPWSQALDRLDFAFQPIVNIHTGFCFGYEALLRHHQEAGFATIQAVFDAAWLDEVLPEVEAALRGKVLARFALVPHFRNVKLFLNVDNRSLDDAGPCGPHTRALVERHNFPTGGLAFEISERHPLSHGDGGYLFQESRSQGYKLAIDDFGTGFSGLQLLYLAQPDFIKIDRFFISDIATDNKKKLFLSHITHIAHLLGIMVVAEGVETEHEYFICKDIGCDLVQGWLVQKPTLDTQALLPRYAHIEALGKAERRARSIDRKIINQQIELIEPLVVDADMQAVFDRFRANKNATFFPVVDCGGEPLGIVRERDFKDYTYSLYGKELMSNKAFGRTLKQFVTRCPVANIAAKAEDILQIFSADENTEGIIIVSDMKYVGFLSAKSLLRVINEKNLAAARDQNPLSRLPGNNLIHEFVSEALSDVETPYTMVYLDFDNFKPFNDKYGFRLGDRAILMFAELLRNLFSRESCFVGHVGGDDFFAGFRAGEHDESIAAVETLLRTFRNDVESMYDDEARRLGYITGHDRQGNAASFPLLGASAAILDLPAGRPAFSTDEVSLVIAELKKNAKHSPDRMCAASLYRPAN